MSARLSILTVKNSRSFELTKIRHYLDKPYPNYFERAKDSPPVLPRLRAWQDESLRGAINPASEQQDAPQPPPAPTPSRTRMPTTRRAAQRAATKAKPEPAAQDEATPLTLAPSRPAGPPSQPQPRKALSLGAVPPPPPGESCDVREILAAAAGEQDAGFNAMTDELREETSPNVRQAVETLDALHRSFGDGQK
jgi:type IV secretion system protein VirD4